MKKFVMVLVAGLLVTALAVPALAWEYSMSGDWEYKYAYIARTGQNDLYGNAFHAQANPNLGTTIGLSGPFGGAVVPEAYSAMGSDGSYTVQRFRIYPQIRLNPALRWRGELTMAASNQQHYWDWTDADGASVRYLRTMAVPRLRRSWVTAQLPWGILAVGRRPGNWGTGWATLHPKDIHSDSVAVVAPYGPLTLILTHYLHDTGQDIAPGNVAVPGQNATDNNLVRKWNFAYAIAYNAGDLSLGTLSRYVAYDDVRGQAFADGRRIVQGNTTSFASIFINANAGNVPGWPGPAPISGDVGFLMQVSYLKYNNGRFFANGEYTFQYADANRNGARPLSAWTQAWHAELGTVVGPAKVTLAHFYSSGHDRRGGAFGIGAVGTDPFPLYGGAAQTYDGWRHFISFGNRQHAIKPFQYLIGLYGGGNNSYDGEGYSTFDDFLAYALRLDYALAANLNVYGSFMWAERASNTATPIAFYSGGLAGGTAIGNRLVPLTNAIVPNVPETHLGWEIDAGVDWKLLEGLTFRSLFAYWQPGDWFKWAYTDQSPNPLTGAAWTTTINNVNYQINTDRSIDPIIGFKGSMVMEF